MSHRLASLLALFTLSLPVLGAACGGKVVLDGTGGAGASTSASSGGFGGAETSTSATSGGFGGAETSTSSGSAGGAGGMPPCSTMMPPKCGPGKTPPSAEDPMVCFAPAPGQACPDAADAMPFLKAPSCAQIVSVQAACSGGPAGECCYNAMVVCACA